jgi:hypothetical protein
VQRDRLVQVSLEIGSFGGHCCDCCTLWKDVARAVCCRVFCCCDGSRFKQLVLRWVLSAVWSAVSFVSNSNGCNRTSLQWPSACVGLDFVRERHPKMKLFAQYWIFGDVEMRRSFGCLSL